MFDVSHYMLGMHGSEFSGEYLDLGLSEVNSLLVDRFDSLGGIGDTPVGIHFEIGDTSDAMPISKISSEQIRDFGYALTCCGIEKFVIENQLVARSAFLTNARDVDSIYGRVANALDRLERFDVPVFGAEKS